MCALITLISNTHVLPKTIFCRMNQDKKRARSNSEEADGSGAQRKLVRLESQTSRNRQNDSDSQVSMPCQEAKAVSMSLGHFFHRAEQ